MLEFQVETHSEQQGTARRQSKSGLLASVTRQAWDKHDQHPDGRLPSFPAHPATSEEGLYSIYRDLLWVALAWAKAGEYKMRLTFSVSLSVPEGRCGVVAFGGRGNACLKAHDEETLERVRQAVFAFAASDGFRTDISKLTVSWMSDADYEKAKHGAFVKKPLKREVFKGLSGVDASVRSRTGAW